MVDLARFLRPEPDDEEAWLAELDDRLQQRIGDLVNDVARGLAVHPDMWRPYIEDAQHDATAWDILAEVRRFWQHREPVTPLQRRAVRALMLWWFKVERPKSTGGRPSELLRDIAIVSTIQGIHEVAGKPYTSDQDLKSSGTPVSACGVVAQHLDGLNYARVKRIWEQRRTSLRHRPPKPHP